MHTESIKYFWCCGTHGLQVIALFDFHAAIKKQRRFVVLVTGIKVRITAVVIGHHKKDEWLKKKKT